MANRYGEDLIKRAVARVKAGDSLSQISRDTRVARSTLREWAAGRLPRAAPPPTSEVAQLAGKRHRDEARQLRAIKRLYAARLGDPAVVNATTAKEAAVTYGILSDKEFRLEGGRDPDTTSVKVAFILPNALRELAEAVIHGRRPEPLIAALPEPRPVFTQGSPLPREEGAEV